MTAILTGRDLTREQVLRVARGTEAVALDPEAVRRMRASREIVDRALSRRDAAVCER